MCGVSARTRRSSSSRLAGGVEPSLVALDLRGVGHPLVRLGLGRGTVLENLHQELPAQLGETRGERSVVVVGVYRLGALGEDRPGVELRHRAHDRDAGLRIAGLDGPLHRRRSAPPRQERGVHVEHLVAREKRLADERAVGADQNGVRARGVHLTPAVVRAHVVGLRQLDAQLAGGVGHRGALHAPPAAARAVRAADHQRGRVPGGGKACEHRRGEGGCAHVDRAHPSHPTSLNFGPEATE